MKSYESSSVMTLSRWARPRRYRSATAAQSYSSSSWWWLWCSCSTSASRARNTSRGPSKRMPPPSTTTTRVTTSTNASISWVTTSIVTPSSGQPAEHLGEDVLVGGVDPGGRLVHEQHVGLGGERAGDEHPALLPAREGADVGPGAVGEADDVERTGDDLPVGRPTAVRTSDCRTSRPVATISSAVARTDPERVCRCGHVAEAGVVTVRPNRSSGVPNSRTSPPSWSLSPRRPLTIVDLPGAVRAEDRHDLAGVDVEGDVADHGVAPHTRTPPRGGETIGSDDTRRGHQQPRPGLERGEVRLASPQGSRWPADGAGQPFDRVEGGEPGARALGDGLGERRLDEGLRVDRRDPVGLDEVRDLRELAARRLDVGGEARDRDLA